MLKGGHETTLYREILKDAWHVSWQCPALWVFGFFVALLGGGGVIDVLFQLWKLATLQNGLVFSQLLGDKLVSVSFLSVLTEVAPQVLWGLAIVFLVLFLVGLFLAVAATSYGAIVFGVAEALQSKKISLMSSLRAGLKNIFPVFALVVAAKVIIFLLFLLSVFAISLSSWGAPIWQNIFSASAFVAFAAVALIISLISLLTISDIVIAHESFGSALAAGVRLFSKHWVVAIELAVIILIAQFAVGVIAVFLSTLLVAPILLLLVGAAFWGTEAALGLAAAFFLLGTILVFAFIMSWFATFQMATWAALYLRLTRYGGLSKISRLVHSTARLLKNIKKKK